MFVVIEKASWGTLCYRFFFFKKNEMMAVLTAIVCYLCLCPPCLPQSTFNQASIHFERELPSRLGCRADGARPPYHVTVLRVTRMQRQKRAKLLWKKVIVVWCVHAEPKSHLKEVLCAIRMSWRSLRQNAARQTPKARISNVQGDRTQTPAICHDF